MIDEMLMQRRRWFRCFPEGTLEFTVVTRVLALLLGTLLLVVPTADQPIVLTALVAMLWLDYALVMWWAVQVHADLECLLAPSATAPVDSSRYRIGVTIAALLPSVAMATVAAPKMRATLPPLVIPALLVLSVILLAPATAALRRMCVGPKGIRLLLLVPGAHCFAIHHRIRTLLADLNKRSPETTPQAGAAPTVAGVMLILMAICLAATLALWRKESGAEFAGQTATWLSMLRRGAEFASILTAAMFAIADLAAMESLQRGFIMLLRKKQP